MNKKSLLLLLIMYVGTGLYMTAFGQSKAELQEKFTTYLNENDFFNKVDEDGDVQFQYKERTYFIDVDEDDASFFRVVLPNIWPIESEEERIEVLFAMDEANRNMKVAKMYMQQENVWVSLEIFQRDHHDYEAYFERCLRIIDRSIDSFKESMLGG